MHSERKKGSLARLGFMTSVIAVSQEDMFHIDSQGFLLTLFQRVFATVMLQKCAAGFLISLLYK